jgi:hypothetical protein
MHSTIDRLFVHLRMHDATTSVRIVVSSLVRYSDALTGRCWPSVSRMMSDTGLSRAGLYEALRWLRDEGLVEVSSEMRGAGIPVRVVRWDRLAERYSGKGEEGGEGGLGGGGGPDSGPGGSTEWTGGVQQVDPEQSKEPSKEPKQSALRLAGTESGVDPESSQDPGAGARITNRLAAIAGVSRNQVPQLRVGELWRAIGGREERGRPAIVWGGSEPMDRMRMAMAGLDVAEARLSGQRGPGVVPRAVGLAIAAIGDYAPAGEYPEVWDRHGAAARKDVGGW